jgi:hypothetical protein
VPVLLKLEKAMQAQRGGDIKRYSELNEQAEAVKAKIDEAKPAYLDSIKKHGVMLMTPCFFMACFFYF